MIRIAVVTVTYNAAHSLRKTIESVLRQDYIALEYWIVDGGSTDATLSIADSYKKDFAENSIEYTIVSKKDNGIFDAMNRSVDMISGEFVLFLNAGDFFVNETVISDVFYSGDVRKYDIVYGDYYVYSKGYRKKYISGMPEDLPKRMICTHQAIFTKAELLRNRKYNIQYTMTADYDFYLSMYLQGKKFKKTNIIIVYFDITGISQKKAWITQNERLMLLFNNGCIDEKSYNKQKNRIWIMCWKKNIISHLPDFIRFKSYELMS